VSTEPIAVEWLPGRVGGFAGHRLMVILAAPGCTWSRRSGGCTNCGFPAAFGTGRPVSADDLEAQLESAVARIPPAISGPVEIDLFVSGSFFNPEEVSIDAQKRLIQRAARTPEVERLLVESRPEHATTEALATAVAASAPVPLEVGIGLESADDEILGRRIRKGFRWADYEAAVHRIAVAGAELLTYVLLKPMGSSEREAVTDAVRTIARVQALAATLELPSRIGLEPCFVAPGTPLAEAFAAAQYRPPWLWSVIEVVHRTARLGPIVVGLSAEGLDPARAAANCNRCSAAVRRALVDFNLDQDPAPLWVVDCPCRAEWRREVGAGLGP
jgi:radical SAM enzyme (TIGR01210 family)